MIRQKQQWVKEKKEKRKQQERSIFLRVVFYFLALSFVVISFYILFFSELLSVTRVSLEGTNILKQEDVMFVVHEKLDGEFLGIFEKNNFLLISEKKIERMLLDNFKKIRAVAVEKIFPDSLHIVIDERKALLIWATGDKKFIIDENGMAYEEADFNSKLILENSLVQINDQSNHSISLGEKTLDFEYIKFILAIRDEISRVANLEIENQYLTSSRISQEVTIKTIDGWYIHLNSKLVPNYSARMLKTFLEKQISQEQRKELEYVDLRTENKIYYKLKRKEDNNNEDDLVNKESDGKEEKDISNEDGGE